MKFRTIIALVALFALLITCVHGQDSAADASPLTKEKEKLINNIKNAMHNSEKLSETVINDVQQDIHRFLSNVQDWRHITEASISQTLSSIRATLEDHKTPPKHVKEVLEQVDGALLDFEADLTTAQQSNTGTARWSFPSESSIRKNMMDFAAKLRNYGADTVPSKTEAEMNAKDAGNYLEYLKSNYLLPLTTKLDSALPTGARRQAIQDSFQKKANEARQAAEIKVKLGRSNAEAYLQQAVDFIQSDYAYYQKLIQENILGKKKAVPTNKKEQILNNAQDAWNWLKAKAPALRVQT
ncbi:hypothetical protein Unana1_03205 [Umbelopsis nana]